MFSVSDNAASAIHEIVTRPGVPPGSGMRIATGADSSTLEITVVTGPQPGDTVHEAGDEAQLFLEEGVSELLDEKTIDARQDGSGRVGFVIDSPGR
jgi:hypothetical protein